MSNDDRRGGGRKTQREIICERCDGNTVQPDDKHRRNLGVRCAYPAKV